MWIIRTRPRLVESLLADTGFPMAKITS